MAIDTNAVSFNLGLLSAAKDQVKDIKDNKVRKIVIDLIEMYEQLGKAVIEECKDGAN